MRRTGFTLIELIAVITLLALLSGATAWSLAGEARRGSRAEAVGRITHADRMARLAARRLGEPVVLRFEAGGRRVRREIGGPERDGGTRELHLPSGFRVREVLVARARAGANPARSAGEAEVRVSTAGRSASYAVRLSIDPRSRSDRDDGGAGDYGAGWLVFSGLSGQVRWEERRDAIESLFTMLRSGRSDETRPDAD